MPAVVPTQNGAQLVAALLNQHNNTSADAHDARDPVSTITATGSQQTLTLASLHRDFGKSVGRSVEDPAPTVTAGGGGKAGVVAAHVSRLRGSNRTASGGDCREPTGAITAGGQHQALVVTGLAHGDDERTGNRNRHPSSPIGTVHAGGGNYALVSAFLQKYHGTGGQHADPRDPMPVVTAADRLSPVTVTLYPNGRRRGPAVEYVVTDIGMRMFTPRELYRAQGFPDSYVIDAGVDGRWITKSAQIRMCGNSVCPPVAEALVRAFRVVIANDNARRAARVVAA